jgi:hypothetical protein
MFHREGIRAVPGPESCIETIEREMRHGTAVEEFWMLTSLNRLLGR